jgi:hypothetical protein
MVISQRFVRGLAANLIGPVNRINEEEETILVEGNETIMQKIRNQAIINIET